jgi:DNA-binding LytR/AlgR family response regulator
MLDPRKFFRINRECIVNIDTISLISGYSSSWRKLTLKNKEKSDLFVVSGDKVAEFINGLINKFIIRFLQKSTFL